MVAISEKRGYALIWAVLIASILLVISTTMANVVMKEIKMSSRTENSNNAYTAAQSGIDWANFYISNECKGIDPSDPSKIGWDGTNLLNSSGKKIVSFTDSEGNLATATVEISSTTPSPNSTCSSVVNHGDITISSTGTYLGTSRKIQNTVKPKTSTYSNLPDANFVNPAFQVNLDKSSSMIYNYWPTSSTVAPVKIGLANGSSRLQVVYDPTTSPRQFRFEMLDNSGNLVATGANPINTRVDPGYIQPGDSLNQLAFQIKMDYSQGLAARVKISQRETSDPANDSPYGLDCLGSIVLDMSGANKFNPFKDTFVPTGGVSGADPNETGATIITLPSNGGIISKIRQKGYQMASNTTFSLTVTVSPAGAATPTGSNPSIPAWSTVTAGFSSVNSGYMFDHWSGDCSSGISVLMDSNKSCTANFVPYVFNGDNFESGNLNNWILNGTATYPVVAAGSVTDPVSSAISGLFSAYVRGLYPGTVGHTESASNDGIMYQDIVLPTISTTKTLSFKVKSSIGDSSYDHNRVDIFNQTAGGTLIKEWATAGYGSGLVTGTGVNYGAVTTYSQVFDSTYSGKTVRLYFRAHCGGWDASMLVDDITLN